MPPKQILWPAKINEFLSVGPRDERGYHPIRTIFQAVSLFDELTIEQANEDSFRCNIPLPDRNTVTKALSLVREFVEVPPLAITLKKEIPTGAGLGGGSSDAAGLLRHINDFAKHPVGERDIQDIALAVGADVPFFLVGGRAKGEGYGEKLTPLPDEPQRWLVIAKPDVECSTKEMYEKLDSHREQVPDHQEGLFNSFLWVAPFKSMILHSAMKDLGAQAGLTGSGSAVFGYCQNEQHAREIAAQLPPNLASWVRVVHTLPRL